MFGLFKNKLKKAIASIGNKIKKKKPVEEPKEEVGNATQVESQVVQPSPVPKDDTEKTITKKKEKKSILKRFKEITQVKLSEEEFDKLFSQLEIILIENSVALQIIDIIKEKLKTELVDKPFKRKEIDNKIKDSLKDTLSGLLLEPFDLIDKVREKKPFVIAFFGINGSGKTTSIAKMVHLFQQKNLSCVLAAADTFRAASIEQLEQHGANLDVKVIKHKYGADPAAVAYDAIAYAKAHNIDIVLIDTAGRMHTQVNLMKEMEKICRVAMPDLKIFVGESIVGNDAVEQAKAFNEAVDIDAIILSKADVDEKGGAAISVSHVTEKPILYLGVGQNYQDLERFNKHKILKSLGL